MSVRIGSSLLHVSMESCSDIFIPVLLVGRLSPWENPITDYKWNADYATWHNTAEKSGRNHKINDPTANRILKCVNMRYLNQPWLYCMLFVFMSLLVAIFFQVFWWISLGSDFRVSEMFVSLLFVDIGDNTFC